MWLFSFYRLYSSIAAGVLAFFFFSSVWLGIGIIIAVRLSWMGIEILLNRRRIESSYKQHISAFKQELGPYGIRIANKAESDFRTKNSLCEVFTKNQKQLKKAVEQLDVMDALFKAGMRPDADEYLLHDLKLKYGKIRLEKEKNGPPVKK
jgi:hypothetical protein